MYKQGRSSSSLIWGFYAPVISENGLIQRNLQTVEETTKKNVLEDSLVHRHANVKAHSPI